MYSPTMTSEREAISYHRLRESTRSVSDALHLGLNVEGRQSFDVADERILFPEHHCRTLLMVDTRDAIGSLAPHLIFATSDHANFLATTGVDHEEVVRYILEHNPHVLLIEGELHGGPILELLYQSHDDLVAIGFSSDRSNNDELDGLVDGAMEKDIFNPSATARELRDLLAQIETEV